MSKWYKIATWLILSQCWNDCLWTRSCPNLKFKFSASFCFSSMLPDKHRIATFLGKKIVKIKQLKWTEEAKNVQTIIAWTICWEKNHQFILGLGVLKTVSMWTSLWLNVSGVNLIAYSVTRSGDLLDFVQLLNAFGNT